MTRSPPFFPVEPPEEEDPQAASNGAAENAPTPRALSRNNRRRLIIGTRRPAGISSFMPAPSRGSWAGAVTKLTANYGRGRDRFHASIRHGAGPIQKDHLVRKTFRT